MDAEVVVDGRVGEDPGQARLALHLLKLAPLIHSHCDPPRLVGSIFEALAGHLGSFDRLHQLASPWGQLEGDEAVHLVVDKLLGLLVLASEEGRGQDVPGGARVAVDDPENKGGVGPPPPHRSLKVHIGNYISVIFSMATKEVKKPAGQNGS